MKALITGVNGFVGGHLIKHLRDNEVKVYGAGLEDTSLHSDIEYYKLDITNKDNVYDVISKIKPDYIFHLAAISAVIQCQNNPDLTKKVNIAGSENIFSACIKAKINPKILITSSAYVYGNPSFLPITEKHAANPVNAYGKSKLAQEEIALKYFRENRLNIIISRSFNHIGPGQPNGFVCSDFAKQIAMSEKNKDKYLIRVGNLSAKRDFTDVRDIVKAYYQIIIKGISGEVYNICSGNAISIQEILDKLVNLRKSTVTIEKDPSLFRENDIPIFEGDNYKLVKQTGWKPTISIDDSLKDILDYWRSVV